MEQREIDLRPYLTAIAERWRWLVFVAVLGAVVAVIISILQPKTYTASASVLVFIRQTGAQVGGVGDPVMSLETIDVGSRRQGLVALAKSDAIEAQLPPDVLQRVAPPDYKPGQLIEDKTIKVRSDGDLIIISASAHSPAQAKELTNAWTQAYVAYINKLYTDQHSQVQLASEALLPIKPSNPPLSLFIAVGTLAGALTGVLVAMFQAARPKPVTTLQERAPREHAANYPVTG